LQIKSENKQTLKKKVEKFCISMLYFYSFCRKSGLLNELIMQLPK